MLENKQRFSHFAAIDWSGAKGSRHKGIAVALCGEGNAAPDIIPPPGKVWSRREIAEWVLTQAKTSPTLFGFDFSFAPPLVERRAYFPGDNVPANARRSEEHTSELQSLMRISYAVFC